MTTPLFLDANVLFSAALGGESFAALWSVRQEGAVTFCTSPQCLDEARRNVLRKRPAAVERLESTLRDVEVVPPAAELLRWADGKLPEDDGWVLAAAVQCGARVLLTGNTKHFGWAMAADDLPLQVRTVRAYLDDQRR